MGKDQPKTEKKAAIKQVDEIVEGLYFIFGTLEIFIMVFFMGNSFIGHF